MEALEGQIVYASNVAAHDLSMRAKRRPFVYLGSGDKFNLSPECIVAVATTTSTHPFFPYNYFSLLGQTRRQTNYGLVDYGNCVAIPNDSHFFPQGMEYRDGLLPEAFDEVRKEIAQRCVFPKVMSVGRAIHAEMLKKPEPGFIAFFNYTATNISPRFSRGYLSAAFVVGYGEEFDMYPNSVACIPFNFLRTRDRAGQPLRDPNSSVVDDVRGFLGASIKSRGTQERVFLQPERAFILPTSFLYFPANFGPISRPKNPVYQEILGRRKGLNYDETELDHYLEFLGPLRSEFTPRVIEGGASDLKK